MIEIKITDFSDSGVLQAIKKFEKLVSKSGLLSEVRDRRYYKKPSAIKREKRNKAKRIKK